MPLSAHDFAHRVECAHKVALSYEQSHGVVMPWWLVALANRPDGDSFAAECGRAVLGCGQPDECASNEKFNAFYVAASIWF